MDQSRIVVYDPTGQFPEGDVLEGNRAIAMFASRGGMSLPIDVRLIGRNAVSEVFIRKWGQGEVFDRMVGQRGCPMLLYTVPDVPFLHWAARVLPLGGDREPRGVVRLVMHSGQPGAITGGLRADGEACQVGDGLAPDSDGGWTVSGRVGLNCTMEGYLGLSLYVVASGIRVVWSAVSQAR